MRTFRGDDLIAIGLDPGPLFGEALRVLPRAAKRLGRDEALVELARVVNDPDAHLDHEYFSNVATRIVSTRESAPTVFVERDEPAPYSNFCADAEPGALSQMDNAMRLPSAVRGSLMPDAHQGYGLPIGGVLATRGTVIPYAVGVDIACRMRLTILDLDPRLIDDRPEPLEKALMENTVFGTGGEVPKKARVDDDLFDADRWDTPLLSRLRDKAWRQVGTSGSGNHFAEFGVIDLPQSDLGLEPGRYLALMSHSGSRGAGAQIASHYSKLASEMHDLPRELQHLSWLDLGTEEGDGYFAAMNLMGEYASLCHAVIHDRVANALGARHIGVIENHHNFAWIEEHDGEQLVVHRKGATPAGDGVLGVIPGSMATPAYVVRGRGSSESLKSASHGAGRLMSRTAARNQFRWNQIKPMLEKAGVRLLSAGIDENPLAYKDIREVMAAQEELIDVVATFQPRIVKMAADDSNSKAQRRRKRRKHNKNNR